MCAASRQAAPMFTPAKAIPALVRRMPKLESAVGGKGPALSAAPLCSSPPDGDPSLLRPRTPFHSDFRLHRCPGKATPRDRDHDAVNLSNRVGGATVRSPPHLENA